MNQEAFARTVLMALATLASETYKTNQMLAEIRSGQAVKPWPEVQAKWEEEAAALQKLTYDHLFQEADFPPDDDGSGTFVLPSGGPN